MTDKRMKILYIMKDWGAKGIPSLPNKVSFFTLSDL